MTRSGIQRKIRSVYNKNMVHWITEWITVLKKIVYSSLPHIKINKSAKVSYNTIIRIMQTAREIDQNFTTLCLMHSTLHVSEILQSLKYVHVCDTLLLISWNKTVRTTFFFQTIFMTKMSVSQTISTYTKKYEYTVL